MADNRIQNDVNGKLVDSAATEFYQRADKDHATALQMSRDLYFGCVWVNTNIPLAAEMPHGGFGRSGYGKDLSGYGLEDYTQVKHVMS